MIFASISTEQIPYRAGQKVLVYPVTVNGQPGSVVVRELVQTNEPNSILVAFREHPISHAGIWHAAVLSMEFFGGYQRWNDPKHHFHVLTTATDDEVDHAEQVLNRLAGLQEAAL